MNQLGSEEVLKRILAALHGRPTRSACIAAERIIKMVGVETWAEKTFHLTDTMQVLQWAFPLNFFDDASLTHPFLRRLGRSLVKTGTPQWNDFAEISGMALLVAHGASLPAPAPHALGKSHDFVINCGEHQIEVEVTRADTKQKHEEAQRLAADFAGRVHPTLSEHDLVIHIKDIFDPKVREEACEKAKAESNSPSAFLEREGVWSIRTCKVLREVTEVIRGGFEDDSPGWWPQSAVKMLCMLTMAEAPKP